MSIVRLLLHLLLSLALVAGGVAPDVAQAMDMQGEAETTSASASPPCHDTAPDPAQPAAAPDMAPGCCDDGACSCDCVHHAPVALVAGLRLPALPADPLSSKSNGRSAPSPVPLPSLRPPIA